MADNLKIGVEVDPTQAVRGLTTVDAALGKTSKAAQQTATGFFSVDDSTRKMGQGLGQALQITGQLAAKFGGLAPEVKAVTEVFFGASGAAAGLGAAFGPVGIAIGVIVGALPALIEYLSDTGDTASRTADSIRKITTDLDSFIAANTRARTEAARTARIAAGGGTYDELTGGVSRQRGQLNAAAAAGRRALIAGGVSEEAAADIIRRASAGEDATGSLRGASESAAARRNQEQIDRFGMTLERTVVQTGEGLQRGFQPIIDSLRASGQAVALAASQAEDVGRRNDFDRATSTDNLAQKRAEQAAAARSGRSSGGRASRQVEQDTLLIKLLQVAEEEEAAQRAELERATRSLAETERALSEARSQGLAVQRDFASGLREAFASVTAQEQAFRENSRTASQEFADSWRGSTEDVIASFQRLTEAQRRAGQEQADEVQLLGKVAQGTADRVGDSFGAGFTESVQAGFGAIISGSESAETAFLRMADARLEGIALESVGEVLKNLALGAFAAATGDVKGAAGFLTSAALWGAAGAVAGGAAAAIDVPSGGGGGGGGPASGGPGSFSGGGSASSEPSTIVVNINSPTDRAQVGQQVRSALNAARRFDARDRGR
jgi:hypothetical protein